MLQGIKQSIENDIATIKSTYAGLGVTASVFSFFQGRATAFAILFAIEGVAVIGFALWGFMHGKDPTPLGAILGPLAGLDTAIFMGVVGHSVKEDYFERRKRIDAQNAPQPPEVS